MSENHPVWDVYDEFRTARLNVKYYSERLRRLQRWNFCLDLVLAVAAPGSAIAGLWFWNTEPGKLAWQILAVVAAVVAVAKPLAGLTGKIRAFEQSLTGYRALNHDLQTLCISIRQEGGYTAAMKAQFAQALDRKGELVRRDPESRSDDALVARFTRDVRKELPEDNFYVPEESTRAG